MPHRAPVFFCAERMKYPHTGLYHFCRQLYAHLVQNVSSLFLPGVYAPESAREVLGHPPVFVPQSSLHKYWMPALPGIRLWHSTYQGSRYGPQNRQVKLLQTVHDLNFLHEQKPASRIKHYLARLQKRIDKASHVVCISEFVATELRQHIQLREKPVSVIYNGCNVDVTAPQQRPQGIPENAPFILSIGTIAPKKNFHVLPACLLEMQDAFLIITGINQDPEYRKRIEEQAGTLGVSGRLLFTGPVSEAEKRWLLAHCTAFAFPSLAEGFGLPIVEAMAYGKPLLLSNCTSVPEIGGPLATYVNDFSADSVRTALAQTIARHSSYKAALLAERANTFSWAAAAGAYQQLYQQLLHS